jgi:hypothetical protein
MCNFDQNFRPIGKETKKLCAFEFCSNTFVCIYMSAAYTLFFVKNSSSSFFLSLLETLFLGVDRLENSSWNLTVGKQLSLLLIIFKVPEVAFLLCEQCVVAYRSLLFSGSSQDLVPNNTLVFNSSNQSKIQL